MMNRTLIALCIIFFISGCKTWKKPEADQMDRKQALAECEQKAENNPEVQRLQRKAEQVDRMENVTEYEKYSSRASTKKNIIIQNCMRDKGWEKK